MTIEPEHEKLEDFIGYIIVGFVSGSVGGMFLATIAPVALGIALGIAAGVIVGIGKRDIREFDDLWEDGLSYLIVGAVIGAILFGVGWGLENEFVANIIFIPMFSAIGYTIGKPIEKIMGKREEYEQRISEYKTKYEQLKEEGFEADEELEVMLK